MHREQKIVRERERDGEMITVTQIRLQCKETYLEHWTEETKSQSRLDCYLALNREWNRQNISLLSETDPNQVQAKGPHNSQLFKL